MDNEKDSVNSDNLDKLIKKCLTAKYVIIFLLTAIVFLLSYYLYAINGGSDKNVGDDSLQINEVVKLTPAEVQEERRKLSRVQDNSVATDPIVIKSTSASTSEVNPKTDMYKKTEPNNHGEQHEAHSHDGSKNYDHEVNLSSKASKEEVGTSSLESFTEVSSTKQSDGATVSVYESGNSKITITRVEKDRQETEVARVLEGTIFQINQEHNEITLDLKGTTKLATLHLNENTKITINGKFMNSSDLKERDQVRVEGIGTEGSNNIEADVIEVTGFLRFNPPGS